jgi:uncharacterized membrane protein YcgQ (UPF0703/DUF1980 family)
MKRFLTILILCVLLLSGCANRPSLPSAPAPDVSKTPSESSPQSTPPVSSQENTPPAENNLESPKHPDVSVSPPSGDLVEIKEKMFIAQSNDIYLNAEDYLGKTIKYEGIFKSIYWEAEDETYYFVIRYGPGCCGYDGEAGFEVTWDGEWPQDDDWCEAVGVLEQYEIDGLPYLRLSLTSLTVLNERGAEFVYQ